MKTKMMLIAVCAMFLFSMLAFAGGQAGVPMGGIVGTNAVMVMADRTALNAPVFSNGLAVAQGAMLSSGRQIYWTVTAGTLSSNAPTHNVGIATNGAAILCRVPTGVRNGFAIINTSASATLYVFVAQAGTASTGIVLSPNGGSWLMGADCPQWAVYVSASVQGATYATQEW